jgi:hypothetical protein
MPQTRDHALDQLEALVGEWDVEASHPTMAGSVPGRVTFEWLPGRAFLVQRSEMTAPFPSSIAVIGGGDNPGTWPMHYFDSRGVTRLYELTVDRGTISISRDDPEFAQRGTLTFEDKGQTLRSQFEAKERGEWRRDALFVHRRRRRAAPG